MKQKIIGRNKELEILNHCYRSNKPEFITVYGRRRVGKTFLIRNYFSSKKNNIFFKVTGMQNGNMPEQIANFSDNIGDAFLYPGARLEPGKTWRDTFKILTDNIKVVSKNKKIILFFDEFPWMATQNSKLLQTLEYFWNHHWSGDERIKLIVCGSSASWILKNIVNNKGGLYNRVTRSIHLEPLNLHDAKNLLLHRGIKLTNKQVAEIYMVIGGIPHYLQQVDRGLSATQAIERLAFRKNSFLLNEFDNLYATLFNDSAIYIEIVKTISKRYYGIGQEELFKQLNDISSGGRVVNRLKDLEDAGFIMSFTPYFHRKKGIYYKVTDEYSLFYFNWIEPIKNNLLKKGLRQGYWEKLKISPLWYSWAGYAFESLCFKHLSQISESLNLNPTAVPNSWRYSPVKNKKEKGAQIDLLFDRDDDAITLCEIKYTENPFSIDKSYTEKLKQKISVFKEKTRIKKQIFLSIISANGLKKTIHSENIIDSLVVLDDLFKKEE